MEQTTLNRLIKWLKEHKYTDAEIVNCIEYITSPNKGKNKNKEDDEEDS